MRENATTGMFCCAGQGSTRKYTTLAKNRNEKPCLPSFA
jgi:hypothetical protein